MRFSPIVPVLITSSVLVAIGGFGLYGSVASPPSLMSRADARAARAALEVDARAALAACGALEGRAASVCKAQARGEARIRRADLEARYRGTAAAQAEAERARVQALYGIDSARCGYLMVEERTACRLAVRSSRSADMLSAAAPPWN